MDYKESSIHAFEWIQVNYKYNIIIAVAEQIFKMYHATIKIVHFSEHHPCIIMYAEILSCLTMIKYSYIYIVLASDSSYIMNQMVKYTAKTCWLRN